MTDADSAQIDIAHIDNSYIGKAISEQNEKSGFLDQVKKKIKSSKSEKFGLFDVVNLIKFKMMVVVDSIGRVDKITKRVKSLKIEKIGRLDKINKKPKVNSKDAIGRLDRPKVSVLNKHKILLEYIGRKDFKLVKTKSIKKEYLGRLDKINKKPIKRFREINGLVDKVRKAPRLSRKEIIGRKDLTLIKKPKFVRKEIIGRKDLPNRRTVRHVIKEIIGRLDSLSFDFNPVWFTAQVDYAQVLYSRVGYVINYPMEKAGFRDIIKRSIKRNLPLEKRGMVDSQYSIKGLHRTVIDYIGRVDKHYKKVRAVKKESFGSLDKVSKKPKSIRKEYFGSVDKVIKRTSKRNIDRIGLKETYRGSIHFHRYFLELMGLLDSSRKKPKRSVTERYGLKDITPRKKPKINIRDAIGQLDSIGNKIHGYHKILTERIGLFDKKIAKIKINRKDYIGRKDVINRKPTKVFREIIGIKELTKRVNVDFTRKEAIGLSDKTRKIIKTYRTDLIGLIDKGFNKTRLMRIERVGLRDYIPRRTIKRYVIEINGRLDKVSKRAKKFNFEKFGVVDRVRKSGKRIVKEISAYIDTISNVYNKWQPTFTAQVDFAVVQDSEVGYVIVRKIENIGLKDILRKVIKHPIYEKIGLRDSYSYNRWLTFRKTVTEIFGYKDYTLKKAMINSRERIGLFDKVGKNPLKSVKEPFGLVEKNKKIKAKFSRVERFGVKDVAIKSPKKITREIFAQIEPIMHKTIRLEPKEILGFRENVKLSIKGFKIEKYGLIDNSSKKIKKTNIRETIGTIDRIAKRPKTVKKDIVGLSDFRGRNTIKRQFTELYGKIDRVSKKPKIIRTEKIGRVDYLRKSARLIMKEIGSYIDKFESIFNKWQPTFTAQVDFAVVQDSEVGYVIVRKIENIGLKDLLNKKIAVPIREIIAYQHSFTYDRWLTFFKTIIEKVNYSDRIIKKPRLSIVERITLKDTGKKNIRMKAFENIVFTYSTRKAFTYMCKEVLDIFEYEVISTIRSAVLWFTAQVDLAKVDLSRVGRVIYKRQSLFGMKDRIGRGIKINLAPDILGMIESKQNYIWHPKLKVVLEQMAFIDGIRRGVKRNVLEPFGVSDRLSKRIRAVNATKLGVSEITKKKTVRHLMELSAIKDKAIKKPKNVRREQIGFKEPIMRKVIRRITIEIQGLADNVQPIMFWVSAQVDIAKVNYALVGYVVTKTTEYVSLRDAVIKGIIKKTLPDITGFVDTGKPLHIYRRVFTELYTISDKTRKAVSIRKVDKLSRTDFIAKKPVKPIREVISRFDSPIRKNMIRYIKQTFEIKDNATRHISLRKFERINIKDYVRKKPTLLISELFGIKDRSNYYNKRMFVVLEAIGLIESKAQKSIKSIRSEKIEIVDSYSKRIKSLIKDINVFVDTFTYRFFNQQKYVVNELMTYLDTAKSSPRKVITQINAFDESMRKNISFKRMEQFGVRSIGHKVSLIRVFSELMKYTDNKTISLSKTVLEVNGFRDLLRKNILSTMVEQLGFRDSRYRRRTFMVLEAIGLIDKQPQKGIRFTRNERIGRVDSFSKGLRFVVKDINGFIDTYSYRRWIQYKRVVTELLGYLDSKQLSPKIVTMDMNAFSESIRKNIALNVLEQLGVKDLERGVSLSKVLSELVSYIDEANRKTISSIMIITEINEFSDSLRKNIFLTKVERFGFRDNRRVSFRRTFNEAVDYVYMANRNTTVKVRESISRIDSIVKNIQISRFEAIRFKEVFMNSRDLVMMVTEIYGITAKMPKLGMGKVVLERLSIDNLFSKKAITTVQKEYSGIKDSLRRNITVNKMDTTAFRDKISKRFGRTVNESIEFIENVFINTVFAHLIGMVNKILSIIGFTKLKVNINGYINTSVELEGSVNKTVELTGYVNRKVELVGYIHNE